MILELDKTTNSLVPLRVKDIKDATGGNEKLLENYLKQAIGSAVLPEYRVFGNERSFQCEADLFAVNSNGNLVVFELKVNGTYDRGKIYQGLHYAERFSRWTYVDMNTHFKKCFGKHNELLDAFEEQFGHRINESQFNTHQSIVVISHASSLETKSASDYWSRRGIDIKEYFYRFIEVNGRTLVELSTEIAYPEEGNAFWINTCNKYHPDAVFDMVYNKKASAYGNRSSIIGDWMKKAEVFLYHNGYGIVAYGKATSVITPQNRPFDDEERAVTLSDFVTDVDCKEKRINKWISPGRIRSLLDRDFYFPNTLVTLTSDEARLLREECKREFSQTS